MKKRTPPEKQQKDFKNNPFRTLKSFTPKASSVGKQAPHSSVKQQKPVSTAEDHSLFLRAMEGTKKIDEDQNGPPMEESAGTLVKIRTLEHEDQHLFFESMKKMGSMLRGPAPDPEPEEQPQRSSSSRLRQLKRGTIRISRQLDLHGYLKDEALKRLEQFISAAFKQECEAVLVITGKGINSPDGPVLQGAVAEWLAKQGKTMVAESAPAPRDLGGSGAVVVFLRK